MIRGGWGTRRIARLLVCACTALAAVPAAASAQSAVDEYQLEIPGAGGSSPANPNEPPSTGASASSAGGADPTASGDSGSTAGGTAGGGDGKNDGTAADKRGDEQGENLGLDSSLHEDTGSAQPLDTSSRSAPEVVADTLLDSAMLPLLAVLALITGAGAWRLLRNRRTLSGQAG
jgi:hypothetical protein